MRSLSRLIKTAAAAAAAAPALRIWQELDSARPRPPGAARGGPGSQFGSGAAAVPAPGAASVTGSASGPGGVPGTGAQPAGEQAAAGGPRPAAVDAAALRRRLEEERRRGYEAGRAEGFREAMARLEEAVRAEAAALRAELDAFIDEERAYRQRSERALVDLALAVAGQVVRTTVAADPAVLLPLVAEAAGRVAGERVRARVHPDQAETLAARAREGGLLAQVEFQADPALEPGDVILESPRGRYDLRPSVLLERVRRRLEAEVDPA
nr:hypothetical protein [Bacillota bacterium]